MKREERLKLAKSILASEEWTMLKEDWEIVLKYKNNEIRQKLEDEKTHGVFLAEGFRLGLEYCLNTPQRLKEDNQKYFDRLYQKIVGGEHGA